MTALVAVICPLMVLAGVSRLNLPLSVMLPFAAVTIGFLPGLVLCRWLGLDRHQDLIDVLALSAACSFLLIQAGTVIIMTCHLDLSILLDALMAATILGAVWRPAAPGPVSVGLRAGHLILMAAIAVVAARLYLHGSPIDTWEDAIHTGVIRRLLALPALDSTAINVVRDFTYTYPFPGTHAFIALMTAAAGTDPVLTYHKLRFLWFIQVALTVHTGARLVFRHQSAGQMAAFACVVLTATGTLADVPGYYWAQMAPFSHVSDVAMNVLLPSSVMLVLLALERPDRRGAIILAILAILYATTLVMVHPREAAQWLVYLAAFSMVTLPFRRWRPAGWRAAMMFLATLAIAATYHHWHVGAVSHVAALEASAKQQLMEYVRSVSLSTLFGNPAKISFPYMSGQQMFFHGLNWLALLVGGGVLLVSRGGVSALFTTAAVLAYATIIRVPAIGMAYYYFTYDEILVTPVRNVVFFVFILAGGAIFAVAQGLTRLRSGRLAWVAAILVACVLAWAAWRGSPWTGPHTTRYFTILVVLYALALTATLLLPSPATADSCPPPLARRRLMLFVAMIGPMAALAAIPGGSPFRAATVIDSDDQLLASFRCHQQTCPPDRETIQWMRLHLKPSAIVAFNIYNEIFLAQFVPLQLMTWPAPGIGNYLNRNNFPLYYSFFDKAAAQWGVPPFFNDREGVAERRAFLEALGITHVVVDPATNDMMTRTLAAWPDMLRLAHQHGGWSVYEVVQPPR